MKQIITAIVIALTAAPAWACQQPPNVCSEEPGPDYTQDPVPDPQPEPEPEPEPPVDDAHRNILHGLTRGSISA